MESSGERRRSNTERTPLTATAAAPAPGWTRGLGPVVWMLFSAMAFIGLSAALINYNKFLMQPDYFPYAVPLTWLHMFCSTIFSWLLYLAGGSSLFPSVPSLRGRVGETCVKFLPISVAFAISIALSNEAYKYCSVPFLQMCKEFNVVMVYAIGVAIAVETFKPNLACVLGLVTLGCAMSVHGEMSFSALGFGLQIGCQGAEVIKIAVQQLVMQGLKIDPLTTVMILGPQCLVCLSIGLPFVWQPGVLTAARAHWVHLVLNCANAFLLNVAVANIIGSGSALTMVICGVVKDITIVLAAMLLFRAQISHLQACGFALAIIGVLIYSTVRSAPEATAKYGVAKTVAWRLLAIPPEKAAPEQHRV